MDCQPLRVTLFQAGYEILTRNITIFFCNITASLILKTYISPEVYKRQLT